MSKQVKTVEFGLNEYLERYVSEIKLVLQSGTLERSNGSDGAQSAQMAPFSPSGPTCTKTSLKSLYSLY